LLPPIGLSLHVRAGTDIGPDEQVAFGFALGIVDAADFLGAQKTIGAVCNGAERAVVPGVGELLPPMRLDDRTKVRSHSCIVDPGIGRLCVVKRARHHGASGRFLDVIAKKVQPPMASTRVKSDARRYWQNLGMLHLVAKAQHAGK